MKGVRKLRSIVKVGTVLTFSLLLAACGEDVSERKHVDLQYLNFDAINSEDYLNDGITDSTNDDLVDSVEGEFVKWTATVDEITSDKKIILKEKKLPEISVKLNDDVNEELKIGDIVTVSGNLDSYVHGLFATKPKWNMSNGAILETTDLEKENLAKFHRAIEKQKKQLVDEEEQQKLVAQKLAEKEAKDRVVQEEKAALEQAEQEEKEKKELAEREVYLATPEGIKETLTEGASSMGEVIKVWNEKNSWVIEMRGQESLTPKMTRNTWVDQSSLFFEDVFTKSNNIDALELTWSAELTDLKGNVSLDKVMEIKMTTENAGTIKWDNFDSRNLPQVADGFWEHEALNK